MKKLVVFFGLFLVMVSCSFETKIQFYDAQNCKTIEEIKKVYKEEYTECILSYETSDVFITFRDTRDMFGNIQPCLDINYMGKDKKIHCIDFPDLVLLGNCSFITSGGDEYEVNSKWNNVVILENNKCILDVEDRGGIIQFNDDSSNDLWYFCLDPSARV